MEDEAVVKETAAGQEKRLVIQGLVSLCILHHGTSRDQVKSFLGPPTMQGGTSHRYRTPSVYKYGAVEIFFGQRARDGIAMICTDDDMILPPLP